MRLIMFDMDGTLIDSGLAIANTVNHVREQLGFEKLEINYVLEKVNEAHLNTSEFFYGTKNYTEEQTKLFEDYYNADANAPSGDDSGGAGNGDTDPEPEEDLLS